MNSRIKEWKKCSLRAGWEAQREGIRCRRPVNLGQSVKMCLIVRRVSHRGHGTYSAYGLAVYSSEDTDQDPLGVRLEGGGSESDRVLELLGVRGPILVYSCFM